jgi:RNA polymerase sigma factor (sigma-70 family)
METTVPEVTMTTALLPRFRVLLADRRADSQSDAELLKAFVASRDEQAFAALVRRHGPLVLATARRATGNPADADDVFQATFLLLARHAASIRNPAAVAGWLHGTANRVARTARRAAARRRTHEARVAVPRPSAHCELTWREVQQAFEEELAKLPDRYRVPFVLCVLNAEARADVARRLRIREGTISSRLAEAKRRLQERLTGRGISLAVVLGTVSIPNIAVSAELIHRSVRTAFGQPVPAVVSSLVRGSSAGLRSVGLIGLVLAAGLSLAALGKPGDVAGNAPTPPKQPLAPVADPPKEKIIVRGTVVDTDGKPVAGAPVRLWTFRVGDQIPEPKATTDDAGRFQFDAAPADRIDDARVVVTPKGKPAQWLPLAKFASEQTLRLPPDDVPFIGRIVSLENQPLKGITVQIIRASNVADGTLAAWELKNVEMRKKSYWLNEDGLVPLPGGIVMAADRTSTDANGKFKLTDFGRDRVLTVRISGPGVETKHFWVLVRPGGHAINVPDVNFGVYGPDMTIRLGPSRPLVGTVRDAKTGQPVPGVIVSEANHHVPRSVTDKDGRYRIEGVPKKPDYHLNVCGARGKPYFDKTLMGVRDVAGLDPLETDLTIVRGVEFTGRVVEMGTGRPVRAEVVYVPLDSNPNKPPIEPTIISSDGWRTRPDGSIYVTAWPGKGVLWVVAHDDDRYASVSSGEMLEKLGVRSRFPVGPVHAMIPVDVDESTPDSLTATLEVEPAKGRPGKVVDPDGKPLSGVKAAGLTAGSPPSILGLADFNLSGLRAGNSRLLMFIHEEKKLGAVVPVVGDSTDPITVKLAPLGTATGKVSRAKETVAGLMVTAIPDVADAKRFENLPTDTLKIQGTFGMRRGPWRSWTTRTAKTDADGKFKLEGLLPGLTYTIHVSDGDLGEFNTLVVTKRGVTVEAGKIADLGELKR